ncbi:unnamed protein product [Zymoseptoria tritici ST99CH_1E4]|uniref:VPS9 domain-containing protein n=1 Tax=Zymoseptoria tritici ST99CH_1E4 TaxID=1276532 RepID=A0A2H1G465_ZYMTR|nr:unnamed protein product [Zymoseptoria tritici ST99CH_1E4]
MAESTKAQSRSKPQDTARSFTRMEEPPLSPSSRKRASTLQAIPAIPEARDISTSLVDDGKEQTTDVFERHDDDEDEHAEGDVSIAGPELHVPSTFDELPIEIRSIAERFLERLSAKVHPTPFTAESLSDLFQEFYEQAAGHIATHIATLSARLTRETPRAGSKGSAKARARAGSGSKNGNDEAGGGEMLTVKEVADRKKARRMLEVKRLALEEAVERGVCEKVYDKIWKHRTTDDDARDEKLRSRTAALALVGIGLKELHMDPDSAKSETGKTAEEKEQEIHQSLSSAREALQRMDDEHYPLGKLQHLTAAHKSIVDTLSQSFPTSSSADEILPTLIYTLITSPPEGINVVSNLNFIQRFRASTKVDGEAAYCLVNLEAAISFLETVDLSSLRADEAPEGPPKSTSGSSTPTIEKTEHAVLMPTLSRTLTPGVSPITATAHDQSSARSGNTVNPPTPTSPNTPSRPQLQQRRISTLVAAQAKNIEAGRDNFLNAADKVYDSINGQLDNSLQFLFGRFKEQVAASPGGAGFMDGSGRASVELPKTLEDARKLVNSPPMGSDEFVDEEGESADRLSVKSGLSGGSGASTPDPLRNDNKMLELLGGKRTRERSADSTRSGGSGGTRRVTWDTKSSSTAATKDANSQQGNIFTSAASTINSINPLNRFGMPGFARFGRAGSINSSSQPGERDGAEKRKSVQGTLEPPTSLATHDALGRARTRSREDLRIAASNGGRSPGLSRTSTAASANAVDVDDAEEMNAREALATLKKCKPPRKRFLEVADAGELRLNEVEELLKEYRRLAKAVGEALRGA